MTRVKRTYFVGSSREDLKAFPEEVRWDMGYALFQAQNGLKPTAARPLKGFGGAGVLEIIENFSGDTYRVVYTVKFKKAIYVLHCFQKKSKRGIETPRRDVELIEQRLRMAEEHHGFISEEDE